MLELFFDLFNGVLLRTFFKVYKAAFVLVNAYATFYCIYIIFDCSFLFFIVFDSYSGI